MAEIDRQLSTIGELRGLEPGQAIDRRALAANLPIPLIRELIS